MLDANSCCLQFKLALAHDGSGKGAALVAAVAKRMMDAQNHNINNNLEQQQQEQPFPQQQTTSGFPSNLPLRKIDSDVEMSQYIGTLHAT